MSKIEKYIIAEGNRHHFHETIEHLPREGFEPYGEPFAYVSRMNETKSADGKERMELFATVFVQAMVKRA